MTHATPHDHTRRRPHGWRLDLVELAARWSRRHGDGPATDGPNGTNSTDGAPHTNPTNGARSAGTTLWRIRTTVRDEPGTLAALCAALARHAVDILALQTHPLADGTVDEFLLRAPADLPPSELTHAVTAGGGRDIWLERADAHDLVDAPTRILSLATRTALDAAELPLALRQLLGRCTIRSLPAKSLTGRPLEGMPPVEGVLEETMMRLRDPSGGAITIERPYLPFTPTEFARARAPSNWTPGWARAFHAATMC